MRKIAPSLLNRGWLSKNEVFGTLDLQTVPGICLLGLHVHLQNSVRFRRDNTGPGVFAPPSACLRNERIEIMSI
jgi:hypothetical protein